MNEAEQQAEAPPTTKDPLAIQTRALKRRFGELVAVDNLDLEVPRGCFFGFLGPNGAGKSTTIKILTGLIDADDGEAQVLGFSIGSESVEVKRRIGVVPDAGALFDRLTGEENLLFAGRVRGLKPELVEERSEELLDLFGLADARGKLVVDYSHGMKKKLGLATALLHGPELLFLDEPFEGVDAVASEKLRSVMEQLVGTGVTIFLTSHILEIVERLCDRVAIIAKGRLVACGTVEELRAGSGDASLHDLFVRLVAGEGQLRGTLSWLR